MTGDLLEKGAELSRRRQPFALAIVVTRRPPQSVRAGAAAIVLEDETVIGWVGGGCIRPTVIREALASLADGQPRLVRLDPEGPGVAREGVRDYPMTCQGEGAVEVYIEPLLPRPELLVLGRTPVARSVARLGHALDLYVGVADPLATAEDFPEADELSADAEAAARAAGPGTFVVVATMGEDDETSLEAAARSDARYVGLVASRKKAESLFAYLRSRELEEADIARVTCPAGLDLGGVLPDEIALSILAEIVQLRRRGGARAGAEPASPSGAGHGAEAGAAGVALHALHSAAHTQPSAAEAVDPVCGMSVRIATARHTAVHAGRTFYFCCPHCKRAFEREPERYLATGHAADTPA